MGAPAARPEREVDDVGRAERERVGAGAVAVGDEDDVCGASAASVERLEERRDRLGVTNGRSIGSTRIASAPPATTSARASARPALRPVVRWRRVRAPISAARARTSRSGLIDQDVVEPVDGQGGHDGPCQEALDEILPLLGVERARRAATWRPRACRPG